MHAQPTYHRLSPDTTRLLCAAIERTGTLSARGVTGRVAPDSISRGFLPAEQVDEAIAALIADAEQLAAAEGPHRLGCAAVQLAGLRAADPTATAADVWPEDAAIGRAGRMAVERYGPFPAAG